MKKKIISQNKTQNAGNKNCHLSKNSLKNIKDSKAGHRVKKQDEQEFNIDKLETDLTELELELEIAITELDMNFLDVLDIEIDVPELETTELMIEMPEIDLDFPEFEFPDFDLFTDE